MLDTKSGSLLWLYMYIVNQTATTLTFILETYFHKNKEKKLFSERARQAISWKKKSLQIKDP